LCVVIYAHLLNSWVTQRPQEMPSKVSSRPCSGKIQAASVKPIAPAREVRRPGGSGRDLTRARNPAFSKFIRSASLAVSNLATVVRHDRYHHDDQHHRRIQA
jgi:hypothetical protein